ncbi:hypothetical protein NIES4072_67980 [Nostoc commune NIES-4072]|jgi:hypothetical protein|uniref:Uncharacterized protein n=1 Tax=Nostoc commune NIES-4072 TaxID=2005467 RepID=A0A2R5FWF2_NOSCO|nr:hypothetical protein [Nostoc commune]BBD70432.1 hypothetical protein NIES4070_68430 [Nostoc commune HK-02]GBG23086.1 hypothetical protein NIES4072_67980 [Nostoc commune NIES-4072]
MNELAKEYPFVHIYAQQKTHQPAIIKVNTEGLCVLLNALISAVAQSERNGMAEVFDGDAEAYEVIVKVVNTHDELSPVPYKVEKQ